MKPSIFLFFQHVRPDAGAGALRASCVLDQLEAKFPSGAIKVYCSTKAPMSVGSIKFRCCGFQIDNSAALLVRLLGELALGIEVAVRIAASRRPSLLIISSPAYLSAMLIICVAKARGFNYILELRDVYPQVYADAGILGRQSFIFKTMRYSSSLAYKWASKVVCATHGLALEVKRDAPSSNVEVVYNGFPAAFLSRSNVVKHRRFTVCFHGVLGFFQDVDTLLLLTDRLAADGVDVVVIGYGRKAALLKESRRSNLRFLGALSFRETIEQVERCHVGLSLRLSDDISRDSFPVKVWEYLGLGIPSLITPESEAGDFVKAHACGFVFEPGDVEGIALKILSIKSNPDYLDQLKNNCLRVAEGFTREAAGVKIGELVDEVIASKKRLRSL
jgi:glycosyltransferase involved in cell wall biosynthesis